MLGRPLRERVAMRATMHRRRMSSIAGSSMFILYLSQRSIIPGDDLERNHLHPGATAGRLPGCLSRLQPPTDVEGTQVEEVDPCVNEQNGLLARIWQALVPIWDPGKIATVLPDQHNGLSLRPVIGRKTETCASSPLQQVLRPAGVNVPGD